MDSISKSFLIFLSLLLVAICNSQPSFTWNRTFDGPNHLDDVAYDICQSTDGYFYAAGFTQMNPSPAYILKLNPFTGDTLWSAIVPNGIALAVAPSNDGGCVYTGGSFATKLNPTGNVAWHRFYGGTYTACYDIIQTSDGGYMACGNRNDSSFRGYIFKIDSAGNLEWQRTYPAGYRKDFYSALEIVGEGYLLVGFVIDSWQDSAKGYILKTNYSGDLVWEKRFRINNKLTYAVVGSKLKNGYLIGGYSYRNSIFENPFFLRTDTSGDTLYTRVFLGSISQLLTDVKPVNSNRYVVSIQMDSIGPPYFDGKTRVLITDSLGNIIRDRDFQRDNYLRYRVSLPLNNGDLIFAGDARQLIGPHNDIIVTRTDSLLNAPPIGIMPIGNEIPDEFALAQNYPNPFNNKTIINFSVGIPSGQLSIINFVRLTVYDVLGREIETLVNEELKSGIYQIQWDASNYPSGVYLLTLYASSNIFVRKMILIK